MNTNKVSLISITDIERKYDPGIGRHWFDADTMRFFKSRLPQYGFEGKGGIYFVSSEKRREAQRAYTVRQLVAAGQIKTVGEFNTLTRSQANTQAKNLARG